MRRIDKGWSGDQKYQVTAGDGTNYLLRVTSGEKSLSREEMFQMHQKAASLHIPMCRPVAFGKCKEGVYSIQTWIAGEDAQDMIPCLSDSQQYAYGLEAGRMLKTIHSIPAPVSLPDWEIRFNAKIDRKIKLYRECPLQLEGAEEMIAYIEANRSLLKDRPQSFQHGDYHIGNMMLENGRLVILDFDRCDFGDPWEEFNRIVWCAEASPLFASGMVNGYFDCQVPMEFWKLLALYISSSTLSSLPWAIPFGEGEIEVMRRRAAQVLSWYDHMQNPIPSWYFSGYYLQYIDGLPYKLKSPYDFGFLEKYGRVFQVFDDQDSGNICFGMEKKGQRRFVKYAGAPTERYSGTPEAAIERLKTAFPLYRDLKHPALIQLEGAEEIGGGFALIFQWVEGDCMGRMYPAAHRRFLSLPLKDRLRVFRTILSFLQFVHSCGYVAVDLYDGSILYDFEKGRTTICDVDLFQKKPFVNSMGRMWGSSRFMSPEEFELGAVLDEVTNVYTAGAFAFALFSDGDRSLEKWPLGEALFRVAEKAVAPERGGRQPSIAQLAAEWERAETAFSAKYS